MNKLTITKLTEPTQEIANAYNKWENDPTLIPLMRPCQNEADLTKITEVTVKNLEERLEHGPTWLIYLDGQLIGEMGYQIDPKHLYKHEPNTAWVGITIGEATAQGKGIGFQAMQFLEEQTRQAGLRRMELGVFEFNERAIKLYTKLGFKEIARIDNFTYWQGKMWQDIRMEKHL